jgi:p-cumate 2,3-dioxygenase subunit alpha
MEARENSIFKVSRTVFVSDEVLAAERERIFDASWIFVGHESEVPNPNDFLARKVAGRPVIFLRDGSSTLRVLLNACRHRGAEVCRLERGSAKLFSCFYHGWAYRNTGELVNVPGASSYGPGFDKSKLGLDTPRHVADYRGFVFASFAPEVAPLGEYLGDACRMLDMIADQSDVGMKVVPGVHDYYMNANWKLLMENSCDGYHGVSVHQTYFEMMMNLGVMPGVTNEDPSTGGMRGAGVDLAHGHATAMTWPGRGAGALLMTDESKALYDARRTEMLARFPVDHVEKMMNVSRNTIFFPNFVIVDLTFGIQLRTMWPTSPETTEITGWLLTAPELDDKLQRLRLDNALTFWGPAGLATPDDVEALEQCQRGFATRKESPWTDLSKGLGREVPDISDELPQRAFWREWNRLMTGETLPGEGRPLSEVVRLPAYTPRDGDPAKAGAR